MLHCDLYLQANDVVALPQATGRQLEYPAEAEQTAPDDMRQTDAEGMEAMEVDMSLTGSAQVSLTPSPACCQPQSQCYRPHTRALI